MEATAIIVLGINPTNGLEELHSRVAQGIKEFKKSKNAKLILSGGYYRRIERDPGFREAELMKEYALSKGFSKNNILIETQSRDTLGNAYFTKPLVDSLPAKKVIVVSSKFHCRKAKYFFAFVYGKEYNFKFSYQREKAFTKEELDKMKEAERKSIEEFDNVMKENNINPCEYEKIGALIKNFYPNIK
jgi:uncharacterized SAM-binding protein YcdF (DUF218 family)